ncbi:hypothetical protein [Adhaeribacter soli]|uniref:Uncharacterized protein n=1 Tax=Adhaeribacter soli TaxID=2607655 RepID=A0A5N1IX95_9BACT|nr:hypothetical protein [Adhaeribacter soli]KAA9338960.1 hypothetical protein F0P94_09220 [Adhaeribacter soli]
MEDKFRKKSFTDKDVQASDKGVPVKFVMKLIEKSPYYEDLCNLMGLDDIKDEFIEIPGASKLLQTVKAINSQFEKIDLDMSFPELSFTKTEDDGKFALIFPSIDIETGEMIEGNKIIAKPIYSARSDFFSGLFKMERYANTLLEKGHDSIVTSNLEYLREVYSKSKTHKKKYRLLKDNDGYYFRAITSCNKYYDYNNNITVFIGLIALHIEAKTSPVKFLVKRCEFNESFIRIYFEKEESRPIEKVGSAKYIIEVSNDEVKREALKFSGVMALIFGDDKPEKGELFIKPKDLKTSFLSINHGVPPKSALKALEKIAKYKEREEEQFQDLSQISKINNPDQIRFLIKSKVDKLKSSELSKYKKEILTELLTRVDSIYDLLKLMNKIELIVEDIDAKEYLRYFLHEVLILKE